MKKILLFLFLLVALGQGALAQNGPTIQAPETSSPADFDFLMGKWEVSNHKLIRRLANDTGWADFKAINIAYPILKGQGNTDNFNATINGKPFEGMTVRLFNPKTRLWHIFWADSNSGQLGKPLVGSFEGRVGTFINHDTYEGRTILVKFVWDKTDPVRPVWSQAFSSDEGKTWEWNWYMNFRRL